MKLLGGVHGVLAGHGIDNEQHLGRFQRLANVGQLGHQFRIDL